MHLCGHVPHHIERRNDMEVKELGHLVLYVRDLERSRHFYGDVLGWKEVARMGNQGAVFSSGRTHHELLLLEVGPGATPIPPPPRIGLYHFGLKIGETDEELKAALEHLVANDVTVSGTADHTVTHSLYIEDPDGNEIELYIDVQPEAWRDDPQAIVAPVKALRL
jgi:catechol-2,3-dioxygenase